MTDSDQEFWDVGDERGRRRARKSHMRRSKNLSFKWQDGPGATPKTARTTSSIASSTSFPSSTFPSTATSTTTTTATVDALTPEHLAENLLEVQNTQGALYCFEPLRPSNSDDDIKMASNDVMSSVAKSEAIYEDIDFGGDDQDNARESFEDEEKEEEEEEEEEDDDDDGMEDEKGEEEDDVEDEDDEEDEDEDEDQKDASDISKRTSLMSGSDLPTDSPKDEGPDDNKRLSVDEYLLEPHQRLKLTLYRGRKLLAAQDGDATIHEFVRAQALARIVHGDQHWRYCRCKVFIAQAYLHLKNYATQAEEHAREAVETLTMQFATPLAPKKKPQVHHTFLWGYLIQGEALVALEQLTRAQESLNRAMHHSRIYWKLVSKKKKLTPSLAMDLPVDLQLKVLRAQAKLYSKMNKKKQSVAILKRCIRLVETHCGASDARLVDPLQQLGQLILGLHAAPEDQKQFGLEALERALAVTQASNRSGSVEECEARALLAQHQLQLRRIEPVQVLREMHKLHVHYGRLHGEYHAKTIGVHNYMIQVLIQEEDYIHAIAELRNNLQLQKKRYGDYSPQVCGVLRQLSRVHTLNEELDLAAIALEQELRLETLLYGGSSRRVQATKVRLQELFPKLPLSLQMKFARKHPEMSNRPRFRNI